MSQVSPDQTPLDVLLTHLEWNLKHLETISQNENTEYFRKAALQRYGFTFESALRCIRAGAARQNQTCNTPGECFELATQMGWLQANLNWQELVSDYQSMTGEAADNLTSALHQKLAKNLDNLKTLHQNLSALV